MNELNNYQDIISKLAELRNLEAPATLHETIADRIGNLPRNVRLSGFAAFAVNRWALKAAVAYILILITSATVAYAIGISQPGAVLYSLKQSAEDTVAHMPLGNFGVYLELKIAEIRIDDMRNALKASDSAALETLTADYEKHVQNVVEKAVEAQRENDDFVRNVSTDLKKQRDELKSLNSEAPQNSQDSLDKAKDSAEQGIRDVEGDRIGTEGQGNVKGESIKTDNTEIQNEQNADERSGQKENTGEQNRTENRETHNQVENGKD